MRRQKNSFRVQSVYRVKKHGFVVQAGQQLSFFIAVFSLIAFLIGNMVGQQGVYAFWKSALGKEDDAMIVFTGTVAPVKVPDYAKWSKFGGDSAVHTFAEVPQDLIRDLPVYDPKEMAQPRSDNVLNQTFAQRVYTTPYEGDYATQREGYGSHPAIDIDLPPGTPVYAIANGIIDQASLQEIGFGHYVTVRHPNVPDAGNPGALTTIYSTYAHLDQVIVSPGQIVRKGQQIGTVGKTGFAIGASGYHLLFQIDKATAPWHPYWPFTSTETQQAGLSFMQAINSGFHKERIPQYTLSPMLFVQQYQNFAGATVAAGQTLHQADMVAVASSSKPVDPVQARLQARLAKQGTLAKITQYVVAIVSPGDVSQTTTSSSASSVSSDASSSVASSTAAPVRTGIVPDHLEFRVPYTFDARSWTDAKLFAVDRGGNTIKDPAITGDVYLVSTFNTNVDLSVTRITPEMFARAQGVVAFKFLSHTQKTVILQTKGPFAAQSEPIKFAK